MIEVPDLAGLDGIRHGFFTRAGGRSAGLFASLNCGYGSGDDKPTVKRNRAIVAGRLGVPPEGLLSAHQWHSADAIEALAPWDGLAPPKGDALATATPGLGLGVLTADCAPVLLADAQARVIGAVHAGWKGALAGVTDAAVAAMERLGAQRARIVAVLGPTISQDFYEVGPEFIGHFVAQDPAHARFFKPSLRAYHQMFDLPGYLAHRLKAGGIGRVADLGLCTYADEQRFFSFRRATHRREPYYGRLMSAIALSGGG